jgi:alpha-beta hydrolase superfamily lysophospholipase
MKDVECRLYPQDRHEVLNELDKEQVYADVLDWMKRKESMKY